METVSTRLQKSHKNLIRHGRSLLATTRSSGTHFVTDTVSAGRDFGAAARAEAQGWTDYVRTRSRGASDTPTTLVSWESSAIERGLLLQLAQALEALQERVASRLATLDPSLPLDDYESLTAKAIVAQLDDLSEDQCRVVYAFEEGHKQRATVLRALEQRIAA